MSVGERDPHTGHMTTGHEWNGIKELNTPVPKTVYFFLITTAVFALLWMILMPSWPLIHSYYKGILGVDQRQAVAERLNEGVATRAPWIDQIMTNDYAVIQGKPELVQNVMAAGHQLFGDNCAVCHGTAATGNIGYPNLAQPPMLWGSEPETIEETIKLGINSSNVDTRVSQMLAFGRDQMLARDEILNVVDYVRSLSASVQADVLGSDNDASRKQLFIDNCSSCHGEDAKGSHDVGAPDLTDQFWIYGGSRDAVFESVYNGRQGHMPSWEKRLAPAQIKILTLYVLGIRSKQL